MSPSSSFTRRSLLGGLGAGALLGLGACARGPAPRADEGSSPAPAGWSVEHKYGTTTIAAAPSRVVALGYTDQEPLLALGVVPVGVVDFFGERPYGKWPWEQPLWNGATPQIVGERDTYSFEKIAAAAPDLIVGLYSGMTRADYTKLTKIAPTVAQPTGYADFAVPWTALTETVGRIVGKLPQAQQAIADTQAKFDQAKAAHPEWAGKTVAVAEPYKPAEWAVFGAADPKVQFMQGLGFTVAPSVVELEPGGDVATLSTERLDVLDVDQLVLLVDAGDQTQQQVEANKLFTGLGVSRGRTVFLPFGTEPPVGAALSFNSVLSIPYGIDRVVAALTAS